MLKTTGSSIASAFKVNNNEVVGGSGGVRAESGGNIIEQKVGSIVCNHLGYPENEEDVHPSRRSQRAGLIAKEAPTKVSVEYADFAFSPNLASELPKHIGINDYANKLVDANGFIRPSKSPADAPIFFNRKSDGSFWLYVNYKGPFKVLGHVDFDGQNGHNSHDNLDDYDRSYAPREAGKDIRFASEGLTRLQTTKRVELLNGGLRDDL